MNETGHITLWDIECVFIANDNDIFIIPKNKDDIQKINSHFDDTNFLIKYHSTFGCFAAFIERVELGFNHTIRLFPKYIVNRYYTDVFCGFEIIGQAIDDFFSPSRYFFVRSKEGKKTDVDFIYHNEVADKWIVNFEGKSITITLSYGDILQWGTGSDLMLHPKLTVCFEQTADIQYVYRVYSLITRFLKIIRYETKCGKLKVNLFCEKEGKKSCNGCLHDSYIDSEQFARATPETEYGCYKPYIQHFLQFAADNPAYTFHHYPTDGIRYRGRHYSAVDFLNIFAAFEAECHANAELYENADITKIQAVKNSIISLVDAYPNENLTKEEHEFIKNAKDNLSKQGTEFGQRKKIKNAYKVLKKALESSIENIFYLPTFKCKGNLKSKNLNDIAEFLVGQRGAIAHGRYSSVFSDIDAQKIHFLEVLTYAQMLKRVGLNDKEIERVIGAIFGCNYVIFQEKYQ